MATAVASKPLPQAQKMKRPPPPYLQTSTTSNRPPTISASPSSASKRLPGSAVPNSASSQITPHVNGAGPRPNRQRKETQRMGEPTQRPQRLSTRSGALDGIPLERRSVKRYPEPYVPSEAHILRKYKGHLPSLIVHLHPTHFRFDQQEGSFSYHSEMRMFIEHLQKRTIPHDMLEELRKSEVRFYDGWLIVRVVDHKSVAAGTTASSNSSSDDQISIHNHNPYITPSPWRPYPVKNQVKADSEPKSPKLKQEPGEESSARPKSSPSVSGQNGLHEASPKSRQPQPKVYHVALRPTALSRHMDLVIDSMTPDPKALNRRQSQAFPNTRTPSSSMPPPTPLSAMPPTPSLERGPPNKKIKMKIESKDLLDYEARIVNATAPPLFLDALENLEQAQNLLEFLKDPWHDEAPPSPKGRKRTIAELAADDALAKEQERFMLIMDESNKGGSTAANASNGDGPPAAALFQPRFEKFNALETIKQQHAENKRLEEERKAQQDALRRNQQREEEAKRLRLLEQQQQQQRMEEAQRRQHLAQLQRQQAMHNAAAAAATQPQGANHVNGVSGVPPNMQNQMMHGSQPQRSSPVVRTSTPHMASSPLIGQMSQPGQSVPVAQTASNQGGAGSPPRPGSSMQHGHPGVAMSRGQSAQGPSRHGTPQIPQGTPAMRHSTPVGRHATPTNRTSNASPHIGIVAQTPQMSQSRMMNGMNAMAGMTPQNAAMAAHRQQAMNQQHPQNFNQQLGNAQGMTPEQMAHIRAQNHAYHQRAMQQQMQQQQQQQDGQHPQQYQQHPNQANAFHPQATAQYNAQLAKITQEMLSNQQFQAQAAAAGSSQGPQQQAAQMNHHPSQPGMQSQPQGQPQNQRIGQPNISAQAHEYFQHRARTVQNQLLQQLAQQQFGGNPQLIPQQHRQALQQQAKHRVMQEMTRSGMINPQARQVQMSPQQMMQMQQAAQQQAQRQGGGGAMQNNPQNMAYIRQQMMQQQAAIHHHQQQQQQQQQQM